MNTPIDPRKPLTLEERKAVYLECKYLLNERTALPWWNWWRWNAINREMRALLDSMEEES